MPIKSYLQIIAVFTIISFVSLITIIFKMDPFDNNFGYISIILFYLSLFLTLFGFFSLLNLNIRKFLTKEFINNNMLNVSIRQSLILSFYLIVILFLYDIELFNWTNIILITIIFILTEVYFWD